eukprot:832220-Pelagomonas_calceolata.AAC.1
MSPNAGDEDTYGTDLGKCEGCMHQPLLLLATLAKVSTSRTPLQTTKFDVRSVQQCMSSPRGQASLRASGSHLGAAPSNP